MFGNGRFARNLLEAAIGRHAWLRDPGAVRQLRELADLDQQESGPQDHDPSGIPSIETPGVGSQRWRRRRVGR